VPQPFFLHAIKKMGGNPRDARQAANVSKIIFSRFRRELFGDTHYTFYFVHIESLSTMSALRTMDYRETGQLSSPDEDYREQNAGGSSSASSSDEEDLTFSQEAAIVHAEHLARKTREAEELRARVEEAAAPPPSPAAVSAPAAEVEEEDADATAALAQAKSASLLGPKRFVVKKKAKKTKAAKKRSKKEWPKYAWFKEAAGIKENARTYYDACDATTTAENDAKRIAFGENYEQPSFWTMWAVMNKNPLNPQLQKKFQASADLEEAMVYLGKCHERVEELETELVDVYGPSGKTQIVRTLEDYFEDRKQDPWIEVQQEEEEEEEDDDGMDE
jgi:hypothetical protein